MIHPAKVVFSFEEKQRLTEGVQRAVAGIADTLAVLNEAGTRLGIDWEPKDTSVVQIIETLATFIESSQDAVTIVEDDVAASEFSDPENWSVL